MTASCTPRCTYIRICTLPLACYVKVILCVQHRPSFLPCFLPSFLPSRAVPSFLPSRTVLLFEHDTLPCLNMPLQQRAALKKREDQKLRKRKSREKTKSVAGIIDPATYTADGEYRYMEVGDRFTLRDEFVARAHQDAGGTGGSHFRLICLTLQPAFIVYFPMSRRT